MTDQDRGQASANQSHKLPDGDDTDAPARPDAPKTDEPCSDALKKFLTRHFIIIDFFFYVTRLATRVDNVGYTAAIALYKDNPEHKEKMDAAERHKDWNFRKIRMFANYQSETMVIMIVDNFLSYLSETIQLCILKKPQLLRSSEMVKIEDVLRFKSQKTVVEYLVENKINELSYGGLKDIGAFASERTQIKIWDNDNEFKLLTKNIELRNIYTHNRGVINDQFLRKTKGIDFSNNSLKKGERYHVGYDELIPMANEILGIARRFDERTAKKFKLNRGKFAFPKVAPSEA